RSAERSVRALTERWPAGAVERTVNRVGYGFLEIGRAEEALEVFRLNTRVFPGAYNTW
ncbi:MAG: hypothetical protein GWM90_13805, partial [Gemmatimonadetes bacterium]|nr:hypothetical protein [Gemmatimonadota bacterium]NIQ55163.1 hypothetical protein [Gemmatimonadota bacterium]NIU75365.1 hypothetical protein [Gammaproteobacteria bacterium]NIX40301.1 hypothetical protein [Gemmatimonadota bacterium]NIX45145.1 hypothetical protein [Gemmatimonadota bacterium]